MGQIINGKKIGNPSKIFGITSHKKLTMSIVNTRGINMDIIVLILFIFTVASPSFIMKYIIIVIVHILESTYNSLI